MWRFHNPVEIKFGVGVFETLGELVSGRRYALVTYNDLTFRPLVAKIAAMAGEPTVLIDNTVPNPDFEMLAQSCARWAAVDVIVALGGGSVIDTAKVLAAADGDFNRVAQYLQTGSGSASLAHVPIIAIPTTSGTGSDVTCWATVWHTQAQRKHSLSLPELYPETALIDPALTVKLPLSLSINTALDALSHALESLWNVNRNPVSSALAVPAARDIIKWLPRLAQDPSDIAVRTHLARAALQAGLAFSNTKTAIAHNISYPITLKYGTTHGQACSFTLALILRSVIGQDPALDGLLAEVFEQPLEAAAKHLDELLAQLGIATDYRHYGITDTEWLEIIDAAFAGERGANFIGSKARFIAACSTQTGIGPLTC